MHLLKFALAAKFSFRVYYTSRRGVAQLVARCVWDAEVRGSSPRTPTPSDYFLESEFSHLLNLKKFTTLVSRALLQLGLPHFIINVRRITPRHLYLQSASTSV